MLISRLSRIRWSICSFTIIYGTFHGNQLLAFIPLVLIFPPFPNRPMAHIFIAIGWSTVGVQAPPSQSLITGRCYLYVHSTNGAATLYRMPQEERSTFWEVIVSVILSKNVYMTCVLFRTVSERELFHCTVPKLLIRKRYYALFLLFNCSIVLLFKWQSWYGLPSVIHFRKFHRQHQCTLQLVWGHGVFLVCTVK
jgi:hypothetical protein